MSRRFLFVRNPLLLGVFLLVLFICVMLSSKKAKAYQSTLTDSYGTVWHCVDGGNTYYTLVEPREYTSFNKNSLDTVYFSDNVYRVGIPTSKTILGNIGVNYWLEEKYNSSTYRYEQCYVTPDGQVINRDDSTTEPIWYVLYTYVNPDTLSYSTLTDTDGRTWYLFKETDEYKTYYAYMSRERENWSYAQTLGHTTVTIGGKSYQAKLPTSSNYSDVIPVCVNDIWSSTEYTGADAYIICSRNNSNLSDQKSVGSVWSAQGIAGWEKNKYFNVVSYIKIPKTFTVHYSFKNGFGRAELPSGVINLNPSTYNAGSTVVLEPPSLTNYTFWKWSTPSISGSGNKNVEGYFTRNYRNVTVRFPEGRVVLGNQVYDGDNREYTKQVAQGSSIYSSATTEIVGTKDGQDLYDVKSETTEEKPKRKGYSFVGYKDNNDSIITTLA